MLRSLRQNIEYFLKRFVLNDLLVLIKKHSHQTKVDKKPAELDFMPLRVASNQTMNHNVFEMDEVLSKKWACN